MRDTFAVGSVVLKMLTAIKEIADYGIKELKLGRREVLGTVLGQRIAELFVPEVRTLCSWIGHCIVQIEYKRVPSS